MVGGLSFSLIFHGLFLLLLMHYNPVNKHNPSQDKNTNQDQKGEVMVELQGEIIPRSSDGKTTAPDSEVELLTLKPKENPNAKKCEGDRFYGGIGIVLSSSEGVFDYPVNRVVSEVAHGYPGYRAGILVGDIVLNIDSLRGEPGTAVDVFVVRNGVEFKLTIIREKICLSW